MVVAFSLEWVVAFKRNQWSPSNGMGGRLGPEYADTAARSIGEPRRRIGQRSAGLVVGQGHRGAAVAGEGHGVAKAYALAAASLGATTAIRRFLVCVVRS